MRMSNPLSRREFLAKSVVTTAAAAALGGCAEKREGAQAAPAVASKATELKKAFYFGMLPGDMSIEDRFKLTRDLGLAGVEAGTTNDPKVVAQMREAAGKAGVRIHSVMNAEHWSCPLSSADAEVVKKGVAGMVTSLHNAKDWGADTVLLVPAVVDAKTSYLDAWARSTAAIRQQLIPVAAETGVVIAVEDVWNKFLLSPPEFARYVDQFKSKWVRAYFDVGNIVAYGFPQDWIRTLGLRIIKVHVKDFDAGKHKFVPLLEGSIDWKQVRAAFNEVGYAGYITAELPGGDEKYLREVSARMSRIIEG
jgi:L-ribulose-5-phosphate 3-epimerase